MAKKRQMQHPASWKGVIEPAVWLIFGVWAFAQTFDFDGPLPTFELGAAFWPRMVIGGIIVTAAILLVSNFVARAKASAPIPEKEPDVGDIGGDALPEDAARITKKTLGVFIVPLIYVYAMHKLGFLLITPLFLFGYMYLLGVRRWKTLITVTVGVYSAIVLIFVKLIFTPLPQGAGYFHSLNGQLIGLLQ